MHYINTTTNFADSEGVAANTEEFDTAHTLSAELKDFYDTELLHNTQPELFYAQFGLKQAVPAGYNRVEWRKLNTFAPASPLTEGVIPTGQRFGVSSITAPVNQYGTFVSISDRLELRAYDNLILGATREMGSSAAMTQEKLIRDGLLTGTNVLYCDNMDGSGNVLSTPTECAEMAWGGTHSETSGGESTDVENGYCMLSPTMINKAVTLMRKNRVPAINGRYYAVVHPSVALELREHSDWINVHKYAAPEEIFNGEIGELHGVRFIETANAPVLKRTNYKNMSNGAVYATYLFGADSFGIVDPEGGSLQVIVHDKEEIGGPLNQFSTIGYKFETNGATILYPERVLRIMSCTRYSDTDTEN